MSKSLARVKAALAAAGVPVEVLEMGAETRTAAQAAAGTPRHLFAVAPVILLRASGEQMADFTA